MKLKYLLLALIVAGTGCTENRDYKSICDQNWQYMSDGTRQKCANDRLIEAIRDSKIHDTVYIYKQ